MQARYRCPLCLKPLGPKDELNRLCPNHRTYDTVRMDTIEASERSQLLCPEPDCMSHLHVGPDSLLYRHANCTASKDAWGGQDGAGPLERLDDLISGVPVVSGNSAQVVRHWQLSMLAAVSAVRGEDALRGIWFPFALLLPVKNTPARAKAVIVNVTGEKNVGKTFFAMHVLDSKGYSKERVPLQDFIYCANVDEFLSSLRLRELMQLNQAFNGWLEPTRERRNLKAAFFKRDEEDNPIGQVPEPTSEPSSGLFANLRSTWKDLKVALRQGDSSLDERPFDTLLLYDVAGEAARHGHNNMLQELDRLADVVAIMIEATDLAEHAVAHASLDIAWNRLRHFRAARSKRTRCCLIVTKCDQNKAIFADGLSNKACLQQAFKALTERVQGRGGLSRLRDEVDKAETKKGLIDRIFFVWPDGGIDATHPDPLYIGLDEFVGWCFETEP